MNRHNKMKVVTAGILSLIVFKTAYADDVKILAADFHSSDGGYWSVNVTLKHADTGWDHYADNWRIVDDAGNLLGDRVFYHPHVHEQPFTRSLGGVKVPAGITTVYIDAHDKLHGWTPNRLEVDLGKATDGRLRVEPE